MKQKTIHPVVEHINNIVKDRGLSKTSFAELCGIPEPKWNKISNGMQELSFFDLSKIAESLHMQEWDILTYPDIYVPKETIPDACEECKKKQEIIDNLSELLRIYKEKLK